MEAATFSVSSPIDLGFVGPDELARIRAVADPVTRVAAFADASRINALSSIMEAGSGHIGTSFSVLDLLSWIHLEELRDDDVCFSSKGHDAPAVYAVLAGTGRIDFDLLHRLRRHGGLPGHPDIATVPAVATNTGSLGMGVSKAKGFVRAARLAGGRRRVFVITGDGELQEGQFWESLGQAANEAMGEICVVVDHNKIQSDTWVAHVSDLGDLEAKVAAFGWAVARCDGNDVGAFSATLARLQASDPDRPKLIVADTVKGCGVRAFEPHDLAEAGDALYPFHSGAPVPELYDEALAALCARLEARLGAPVELQRAQAPRRVPPASPQKLVDAYGAALTAAADADPRIVALDADLSLDCGLVGFRAQHPERFVECGIAEQDMVSQAGTLALSGLVPVVHSFACFLTPRAAEQAFNNASEHTKVVYCGFLAGIVPGGPGHSHQSVRDIALMASIPGMTCLEPATAAEAAACVRWALTEAQGPVYLRFVSVPWELGFDAPPAGDLVRGQGTVVREGTAATVICTGPVLLSQAVAAAERVGDVRVLALPWLRDVDGGWLADLVGDGPVLVLDNHVRTGGQGEAVQVALGRPVDVIAIDGIPACGTNDEVLAHHGLDADAIAARIGALTGAAA